MITTSTYMGITLMIALGVILPLAVAIWWVKTRKEKFTTVLVGAATWFVFAIILEGIPKGILFNPALPFGKTVMESAVLYTALGALLAGIFEETGRLVAFKTVLKKRTNKETAISHGIGHGGFEAMFIMGITGLQYIAYATMISTGTFQDVLAQTAATGVDVSSLEALPEQIMAITPLTSLPMLGERIFAMLLHVGLSIMVFYAVNESKIGFYVLAVVLHALFDVPAALYQVGVLNLYVVEAMLGVYAIAFFVIVYKVLYKRIPEREAGQIE